MKESTRMKTQHMRPAYFWLAVLFILISGFAIRVIDLNSASLWADEAYTQLWMNAPADRFLSLILEDGVHVPLYFIILRLFPHDGETLLRLPSVLEGLVGIALLIGVVRRLYHNDRFALLAGALLAYNPFHIWFSRGARPYALLFVFSLLSSYYFLLLIQNQRSRKNWVIFTLSSMAAYMTHYFAAALPLAQYIVFAFVLRRKRRVFRGWMIAQAIAAIPVLIWIVALTRQDVVRMNIKWIQNPVPADLFYSIWNMTLDYSGGLSWYAALGLGVVLIGLLPGLYYAFREWQKDLVDFYWFWLLVAPLVGTLIFSLLVRPLYVDRYFMVSLPALLILIAYGWMRLPVKRLSQAALAVVVIVGMNNVFVTVRDGTDERQGWREAAQYVEAAYPPDDGFVMSSQVAVLSFVLYFGDSDEVLDKTVLFDIPDAGPDGAPVGGEWHMPVKRLWAIYNRNTGETLHNEGVMPNSDPFGDADFAMSAWLIQRRDHILMRKDFNGITVFLVDVQGDVYDSSEFGS
jgi:mannosyltransferase